MAKMVKSSAKYVTADLPASAAAVALSTVSYKGTAASSSGYAFVSTFVDYKGYGLWESTDSPSEMHGSDDRKARVVYRATRGRP